MSNDNPILSVQGVTKIYSNGVIANKDVDFTVQKGEVHALTGENGAGKSTLMKILFGIETPDEGLIEYKGKPISFKGPNDAIKVGVGMVHQHFNLIPSLTVAENIVLGDEPGSNLLFDKKKAFEVTQELAKKYNFDLDVTAKVEKISVGRKQKVEILKALYREAELLILDEPTAVLTPQETEELFEQLKKLQQLGLTIIFISHKLDEIMQICQRITVMRRGHSMGSYYVNEISEQKISKLMVGRDVILEVDKTDAAPGKKLLEINNLSLKDNNDKYKLEPISFSLRSGEIIGVAGVDGSGQQDLVNLITGMVEGENTDSINFEGQPIDKMSIKERRKKGIAYIPEDRLDDGVAEKFNIKDNLISSSYDSREINNKFFMKEKEIINKSKSLIEEYDIRCEDELQEVGMLSGGNMQKVIVAREFTTNPKVLIASQPTRGVDVGAIEFIHKKIVEIRDEGCGVLLVSADLNEILELSDSIIVMNSGKMTAYFENAKEVTEEELGFYMLGMKDQTKEELEEAYNAK